LRQSSLSPLSTRCLCAEQRLRRVRVWSSCGGSWPPILGRTAGTARRSRDGEPAGRRGLAARGGRLPPPLAWSAAQVRCQTPSRRARAWLIMLVASHRGCLHLVCCPCRPPCLLLTLPSGPQRGTVHLTRAARVPAVRHQTQLVGAVRLYRGRPGRELAVRALVAAALLLAAVAVVSRVDSGPSQLLSWSTSFDDG